MTLRPWQEEAIVAVRRRWGAGERSLIGQAATGLGKTVAFCDLLRRELAGGGRALVLAHRDELLDQPLATLAAWAPDLTTGRVQRRRREYDRQVIVASLQSLGPGRWPELPAVSHVVVDEAHHAVADNTYGALLSHLIERVPDLRILGVTATPFRYDGLGLGAFWPEGSLVFSYDIPYGIEHGLLCPVRGITVQTGLQAGAVREAFGDFAAGSLGRAVNTPLRNATVVDVYRSEAAGRRALAFCASVAHAQGLAEAFVAEGVRARAVWGGMPAEERAAALADLEAGRIDVVANCAVLTEGVDLPSVDCLLLARPTRSPVLYRQMVGRGLRIAAGKATCLLIDFLDQFAGLGGLQTHADLSIPEARPVAGGGEERDGLAAGPGRIEGLVDPETWAVLEFDPGHAGAVPWLSVAGTRLTLCRDGWIVGAYVEAGTWRALAANTRRGLADLFAGPGAEEHVMAAAAARARVLGHGWLPRHGERAGVADVDALKAHGFPPERTTRWSARYASAVVSWCLLRREYLRKMLGTGRVRERAGRFRGEFDRRAALLAGAGAVDTGPAGP